MSSAGTPYLIQRDLRLPSGKTRRRLLLHREETAMEELCIVARFRASGSRCFEVEEGHYGKLFRSGVDGELRLRWRVRKGK